MLNNNTMYNKKTLSDFFYFHSKRNKQWMCGKKIARENLHGESVNTNTHQQIANKNEAFRAHITLVHFVLVFFSTMACEIEFCYFFVVVVVRVIFLTY